MSDKIYLDDIGTVLELTITADGVAVDVSGASVKNIIFEKPDRTSITRTASFTTDGTNGKIDYATIADDLDQYGEWSIQGFITLPSGSWHTDVGKFQVYDNL